jgi:hypothetical protein
MMPVNESKKGATAVIRPALIIVARLFVMISIVALAVSRSAGQEDAPLAFDDASLARLPVDTTSLQIMRLDDRCMPRVAKLARLQSFDASNTLISDRGAKELVGLTDLVRLELSWTFVTDELAVPLTKLRNLREIQLRGTRVGDRVCQALAENCADLRVCEMDKTAISTAGLGHLAKLKKLETLKISLCKIDDGAAETIGKMTRLRELHLGATAIGD